MFDLGACEVTRGHKIKGVSLEVTAGDIKTVADGNSWRKKIPDFGDGV